MGELHNKHVEHAVQGLCPKLTIKLQKDAIFFRGKKPAAKNGNNVSGQVKLGVGEGGRARSVAFFMEEKQFHTNTPLAGKWEGTK